jgi:glycosyltransferase involved in cell wall biosynthesis
VSLRVAAVSIAPLFKGAVHGGSQRVLIEVVRALAAAGHRVRVACSARTGQEREFEIVAGVRVEPTLRLRGYFPDPYEVPPNQLADTVRNLGPLFDWADRVYLHADIFHFRGLLPPATPVIRSFHDFHYETALVSAFAYGADVTVVPSDYLRRCLEATVARSGLRALERIEVIPNGIDLARYDPRPAGPRRGSLAASGSTTSAGSRASGLVLLHPHRPDPRKGIDQSLRVVAELKRRGHRAVRLIVPRHMDAETDPETAAHYEAVELRARALGIREWLQVVPWQGERGMPALYRSAHATLCLGNFIESFGLTAYESLACGTPVIAARVGALRDAPDLPDLYRVEHDDIDGAADAVVEAAGGMRDIAGARRVLQERFSVQSMAGAYVRVVVKATAGRPARRPGVAATGRSAGLRRFEVAPWCHIAGDRVYNDYSYRHLDLPKLAATLGRRRPGGPAALRLSELARAGVPRTELDEALRTGVLIPAPDPVRI